MCKFSAVLNHSQILLFLMIHFTFLNYSWQFYVGNCVCLTFQMFLSGHECYFSAIDHFFLLWKGKSHSNVLYIRGDCIIIARLICSQIVAKRYFNCTWYDILIKNVHFLSLWIILRCATREYIYSSLKLSYCRTRLVDTCW